MTDRNQEPDMTQALAGMALTDERAAFEKWKADAQAVRMNVAASIYQPDPAFDGFSAGVAYGRAHPDTPPVGEARSEADALDMLRDMRSYLVEALDNAEINADRKLIHFDLQRLDAFLIAHPAAPPVGEARSEAVWKGGDLGADRVDAKGRITGKVQRHTLGWHWDATHEGAHLGKYVDRASAEAAVIAAEIAHPAAAPVDARTEAGPPVLTDTAESLLGWLLYLNARNHLSGAKWDDLIRRTGDYLARNLAHPAATNTAKQAEPVAVVTNNNVPGEGMHLVRGIKGHLTLDVGTELFDHAPTATDSGRVAALEADAAKYRALNTPEIGDFLAAVHNEALHQRERWAATGDAGKADADWFWLVGYLAGKAIGKDVTPEKQLHHIITTAAACLNWHGARVGQYVAVRPGIAAQADGSTS